MKKLLLFIAILTSTLSLSQERVTIVENTLNVFFKDFVLQAIKWDEKYLTNYATCIYENVSYIHIDPDIKFPELGNYNLETKEIHLANFTLIEPFIAKLVLFHELGHAIRQDERHSCIKCTDIMSAQSTGTFYIYANPDVWGEEMERFFEFME